MKHIISIGIDKANGLTPLDAAVSGAKDFVHWGKSQGYTTSLFSDNSKNVSQSEIFDEINKIVEAKNCEKLIIFFSGHGILKSPSQEVWLLSNAKNNPNESINLTGSIDNARTSGIPYVVFISDACRVLPNELQFTGNGSVVFPICDDTDQDCSIDVLYATRPGSPANEYNSKLNSRKFGLFTQSLIEILHGQYTETIYGQIQPNGGFVPLATYFDEAMKHHYEGLSIGDWMIRTTDIEYPLKSIVRKKARDISITLNQSPDIRIQYQNPKPSLAEFDDVTAKRLLVSTNNQIINKISNDKIIVEGVQNLLNGGLSTSDTNNKSFKSILQDIDAIPESLNIYNLKSNLIKNSELIYDSKGRISFETHTGFTIVGTTIKDIIVNGDKQIFLENNKQQIRIHPNKYLNSALIILKNGHSIPVAILDEFIGTLVFERNRLLTINYTPSRNSDNYNSFEQNENKINFVRAFVASAANEGFDYSKTFRNEFNEAGDMNNGNAGNYLRQEKSLDPSLGLYAVYAYSQEGKFKDIKSVYKYMRDESDNMIFDVAMLAGMLKEENQRLAPFCPMISLGWAYRQKFETYLNPLILEASNALIPSLWTTFDKKGTAIITKLLNDNQIS